MKVLENIAGYALALCALPLVIAEKCPKFKLPKSVEQFFDSLFLVEKVSPKSYSKAPSGNTEKAKNIIERFIDALEEW